MKQKSEIILIIAAVVIVAFFYFYVKERGVNSQLQIGLKTYTNSTYGFSFQYNSDEWTLWQELTGVNPFLILESKTNTSTKINFYWFNANEFGEPRTDYQSKVNKNGVAYWRSQLNGFFYTKDAKYVIKLVPALDDIMLSLSLTR